MSDTTQQAALGHFRRKPAIVQAFQIGSDRFYPDWLHDAVSANNVITHAAPGRTGWQEAFDNAEVKTLHGVVHAANGDWIIRGTAGDYWPCKPDIFAATYEPAARSAAPDPAPVAQVCDTYELRWIGSGPIAPLIHKHGIKVGDYLYAATPADKGDVGLLRDARTAPDPAPVVWRYMRKDQFSGETGPHFSEERPGGHGENYDIEQFFATPADKRAAPIAPPPVGEGVPAVPWYLSPEVLEAEQQALEATGGVLACGGACSDVASTTPKGQEVAWNWLRGVVKGIPTRYLPVSGQHEHYVALPEVLGWIDEGERRAALAGAASQAQPFQQRVRPWLMACFGEVIAADREERNHRFLEEAIELVQACGCTASEAHQLVDYVFGRPVGEMPQEVGGVMVTLAALCLAHGLDMHEAGEVELRRIWTMVEKIRAKQAAKPKHSPLPAAAPQPQGDTSHQVQARKPTKPPRSCAAGRDGDCIHAMCPQLRDGEPAKSGRHCPLDRIGAQPHAGEAG